MILPMRQTMTLREWGMLAFISVLWGGSFLFIGIAVKEVSPLMLVTLRVGIAALALHAVMRVSGAALPVSQEALIAYFWMGVSSNAVPFLLISWGQTHIAAGLASILNATTPLFTALVAHVLTRDEKMQGRRLIGVCIGFSGVAVMIGGAALKDLGTEIVAQIAVLGAAISYAFSGVYGRRFKRLGISPTASATGQITASFLMLLPVTLLFSSPWTMALPSHEAMMAILALGLFSTALAYIVFFKILAEAGATNAALVTFLIPVSAIMLGYLVLGERLEMKHFLGMVMITAGLAVMDGRVFQVFGTRKE
jgi:drug/metabolite transporter (DMT)-like permease